MLGRAWRRRHFFIFSGATPFLQDKRVGGRWRGELVLLIDRKLFGHNFLFATRNENVPMRLIDRAPLLDAAVAFEPMSSMSSVM